MDIDLLTTLFADSTSLGNALSSPASAAKKNSQFTSTAANNPVMADNEPAVAQSLTADTPPEQFGNTFQEQMAGDKSANTQAGEKSKNEDAPAGVAVKFNLAQDWLAEFSATVENSNDGVATKVLPKAGVELDQMIAEYKAANNLDPNTGQSGQNPVLADPAVDTTAADTAGGTTENTTVAATTENLPGQKNTQAATSQTQTASAGGNSPIVENDNTTTSGEPKTSTSNGEGPVIETSVGDNKTAAAGTSENPSISDTPGELSVKEAPPEAGGKIVDAGQSGPSQDTKIVSEVSQPAVNGQNSSQSSPSAEDSSGQSSANDSAPVIVQAATGQGKNNQNSTSNNNLDSTGFEQILTTGIAAAPAPVVTEFSTASAEPAKNTSAGNVSANVSEQIQESIGGSLRQGDNQITIQLNPPELGKVFVKFQEQDGQITGQLEVSKAETRVEIQQILPEIVRGLQESGVPLRRIEVLMTEQSGNQNLKDQSFQNAHGGTSSQHNSPNPDTSKNNTYDSEWLASSANNTYNGFAEEEQMYADDNSISVLA